MPHVIDELLRNNDDYAHRHGELELSVRPRRGLVVVTCMDSRIDVMASFGLDLGEAHIVRNAGARITDDVLRSISVSMCLLGTRRVLVVGHTDCGLTGITDAEVRERVREATAAEEADVAGIEFLATRSLEDELRHGCELLLTSALIPAGAVVAAGVFDVATGKVDLVEPARTHS